MFVKTCERLPLIAVNWYNSLFAIFKNRHHRETRESNLMKMKTVVVGYLETNCYLVADNSGDALVIDPGAAPERILGEIDHHQFLPRAILLTHSHSDHTGGLDGVQRAFNLPVLLHSAEARFLNLPKEKLRRYDGSLDSPGFITLEDGDTIAIGSLNMKVIFTPGHTPGGICILSENHLYSGDTLFEDGVGRTDFDGGSEPELQKSIREKLLILPDATYVHPGHGPSTTIGRERPSFG
jgi:hydroxyacylglutathione hydrolase